MSLIKPFSGIRPKKKFAKEVTYPNISYIDKIIYQGIEFKLKNEQNLYLKEFNVNKINQLLWNIPSLLREN